MQVTVTDPAGGKTDPHFAGLGQTLRDMRFHWQRLIVKEYGSTYAWTAGAILLMLKNYWVGHDIHPAPSWVIGTLLALLAFLTFLYGLARYLKKTQILRAD